jgi:GDPmannose 4,6-dehydratase
LFVTAFFTITSRRGAERILSRAGLRARPRGSRKLDDELVLGNLESQRDWGRAHDYVEAMWLMLQHRIADDYAVATGETHSVREFVEAAFAVVDLPWKKYVKHDESFDRPTEPARLVGCADKIRTTLGWKPAGAFRQLVDEMVEAELAAIDSGATIRSEL